MAANLILTIGLRDIQLASPVEGIKTYPFSKSNLFCLADVKEGSQYLLDNYSLLSEQIRLPIVGPAVNYALDKHAFIDTVILVSTDQSGETWVDDHYKKNDTHLTAQLIGKLLTERFRMKIGRVIHHIVYSNVIFYDDMFTLFDEAFKNRINFDFRKDDSIILMAQSGIDAINMALLLNCIQYYPQAVQLHKPETSDRASELNFPSKFHRNLKKVRLLNSLDNFNYPAVAELDYSRASKLLAEYAYSRLIFDWDEALKYLAGLADFDLDNTRFYDIHISKLQFKHDPEKARQREIYLSAKILLKQKAYSDFLVRIFSLFEILLKPDVENLLKGKIIYSEPDHKEWNALVQGNSELVAYLESCKLGKQKLLWSIPNKHTFKAVRDFFIKRDNAEKSVSESQFNLLYKNLSTLSDLRNQSVHYGVKINISDIDNALSAKRSSLGQFLTLADTHFKVSGFGDYEQINEHMRKLL